MVGGTLSGIQVHATQMKVAATNDEQIKRRIMSGLQCEGGLRREGLRFGREPL